MKQKKCLRIHMMGNAYYKPIKTWFNQLVYHQWYKQLTWFWVLSPILICYLCMINIRRFIYRFILETPCQSHIPIWVVGNISVGGNGKSPFVKELAARVIACGKTPVILSKGYKGKHKAVVPFQVTGQSCPTEYGDEPVMLAMMLPDAKVIVCKNRLVAIKYVQQNLTCDVIICDDGLQDHSMGNVYTIVMDNPARRGNNYCLPLGPLREPWSRVKKYDMHVITHAMDMGMPESNLHVEYAFDQVISCTDSSISKCIRVFEGVSVHAIAAIANPEQFFSMLRAYGLDVIPHVLPDHAHISDSDIIFDDNFPVLMTQKDAVKCINYQKENMWYVPIRLQPNEALQNKLNEMIAML